MIELQDAALHWGTSLLGHVCTPCNASSLKDAQNSHFAGTHDDVNRRTGPAVAAVSVVYSPGDIISVCQ